VEAGQQVEGGSANPTKYKYSKSRKTDGKPSCFCLPQIEAGLWVVSKYVCGKQGRGGNRRAGQAEVS
jgi:hypothetical protein